jgi:elongation factor G
MMKDRLKANAVPIQLPIGKEDHFEGIIDLVKYKAFFYRDDLASRLMRWISRKHEGPC